MAEVKSTCGFCRGPEPILSIHGKLQLPETLDPREPMLLASAGAACVCARTHIHTQIINLLEKGMETVLCL